MAKLDTDILNSLIIGRVEPHIYAFTTQTVPNYLKVGDTYRPVNTRIDEWRAKYPNLQPVYMKSARIDDDTIFRDFAVHDFLQYVRRRERLKQNDLPNIPYYSREFFKGATVTDVDDAIADIHDSAKKAMADISYMPPTTCQRNTIIREVLSLNRVIIRRRSSRISVMLSMPVAKICSCMPLCALASRSHLCAVPRR